MITKKQAADIIAENLLEDITEGMIMTKNASGRTLVAVTSGPHIGEAYLIAGKKLFELEPTKIVADYAGEEYTFQ
jgi:hypothetical protein